MRNYFIQYIEMSMSDQYFLLKNRAKDGLEDNSFSTFLNLLEPWIAQNNWTAILLIIFIGTIFEIILIKLCTCFQKKPVHSEKNSSDNQKSENSCRKNVKFDNCSVAYLSSEERVDVFSGRPFSSSSMSEENEGNFEDRVFSSHEIIWTSTSEREYQESHFHERPIESSSGSIPSLSLFHSEVKECFLSHREYSENEYDTIQCSSKKLFSIMKMNKNKNLRLSSDLNFPRIPRFTAENEDLHVAPGHPVNFSLSRDQVRLLKETLRSEIPLKAKAMLESKTPYLQSSSRESWFQNQHSRRMDIAVQPQTPFTPTTLETALCPNMDPFQVENVKQSTSRHTDRECTSDAKITFTMPENLPVGELSTTVCGVPFGGQSKKTLGGHITKGKEDLKGVLPAASLGSLNIYMLTLSYFKRQKIRKKLSGRKYVLRLKHVTIKVKYMTISEMHCIKGNGHSTASDRKKSECNFKTIIKQLLQGKIGADVLLNVIYPHRRILPTMRKRNRLNAENHSHTKLNQEKSQVEREERCSDSICKRNVSRNTLEIKLQGEKIKETMQPAPFTETLMVCPYTPIIDPFHVETMKKSLMTQTDSNCTADSKMLPPTSELLNGDPLSQTRVSEVPDNGGFTREMDYCFAEKKAKLLLSLIVSKSKRQKNSLKLASKQRTVSLKVGAIKAKKPPISHIFNGRHSKQLQFNMKMKMKDPQQRKYITDAFWSPFYPMGPILPNIKKCSGLNMETDMQRVTTLGHTQLVQEKSPNGIKVPCPDEIYLRSISSNVRYGKKEKREYEALPTTENNQHFRFNAYQKIDHELVKSAEALNQPGNTNMQVETQIHFTQTILDSTSSPTLDRFQLEKLEKCAKILPPKKGESKLDEIVSSSRQCDISSDGIHQKEKDDGFKQKKCVTFDICRPPLSTSKKKGYFQQFSDLKTSVTPKCGIRKAEKPSVSYMLNIKGGTSPNCRKELGHNLTTKMKDLHQGKNVVDKMYSFMAITPEIAMHSNIETEKDILRNNRLSSTQVKQVISPQEESVTADASKETNIHDKEKEVREQEALLRVIPQHSQQIIFCSSQRNGQRSMEIPVVTEQDVPRLMQPADSTQVEKPKKSFQTQKGTICMVNSKLPRLKSEESLIDEFLVDTVKCGVSTDGSPTGGAHGLSEEEKAEFEKNLQATALEPLDSSTPDLSESEMQRNIFTCRALKMKARKAPISQVFNIPRSGCLKNLPPKTQKSQVVEFLIHIRDSEIPSDGFHTRVLKNLPTMKKERLAQELPAAILESFDVSRLDSPASKRERNKLKLTDKRNKMSPKGVTLKAKKLPFSQTSNVTGCGIPRYRRQLECNFKSMMKLGKFTVDTFLSAIFSPIIVLLDTEMQNRIKVERDMLCKTVSSCELHLREQSPDEERYWCADSSDEKDRTSKGTKEVKDQSREEEKAECIVEATPMNSQHFIFNAYKMKESNFAKSDLEVKNSGGKKISESLSIPQDPQEQNLITQGILETLFHSILNTLPFEEPQERTITQKSFQKTEIPKISSPMTGNSIREVLIGTTQSDIPSERGPRKELASSISEEKTRLQKDLQARTLEPFAFSMPIFSESEEQKNTSQLGTESTQSSKLVTLKPKKPPTSQVLSNTRIVNPSHGKKCKCNLEAKMNEKKQRKGVSHAFLNTCFSAIPVSPDVETCNAEETNILWKIQPSHVPCTYSIDKGYPLNDREVEMQEEEKKEALLETFPYCTQQSMSSKHQKKEPDLVSSCTDFNTSGNRKIKELLVTEQEVPQKTFIETTLQAISCQIKDLFQVKTTERNINTQEGLAPAEDPKIPSQTSEESVLDECLPNKIDKRYEGSHRWQPDDHIIEEKSGLPFFQPSDFSMPALCKLKGQRHATQILKHETLKAKMPSILKTSNVTKCGTLSHSKQQEYNLENLTKEIHQGVSDVLTNTYFSPPPVLSGRKMLTKVKTEKDQLRKTSNMTQLKQDEEKTLYTDSSNKLSISSDTEMKWQSEEEKGGKEVLFESGQQFLNMGNRTDQNKLITEKEVQQQTLVSENILESIQSAIMTAFQSKKLENTPPQKNILGTIGEKMPCPNSGKTVADNLVIDKAEYSTTSGESATGKLDVHSVVSPQEAENMETQKVIKYTIGQNIPPAKTEKSMSGEPCEESPGRKLDRLIAKENEELQRDLLTMVTWSVLTGSKKKKNALRFQTRESVGCKCGAMKAKKHPYSQLLNITVPDNLHCRKEPENNLKSKIKDVPQNKIANALLSPTPGSTDVKIDIKKHGRPKAEMDKPGVKIYNHTYPKLEKSPPDGEAWKSELTDMQNISSNTMQMNVPEPFEFSVPVLSKNEKQRSTVQLEYMKRVMSHKCLTMKARKLLISQLPHVAGCCSPSHRKKLKCKCKYKTKLTLPEKHEAAAFLNNSSSPIPTSSDIGMDKKLRADADMLSKHVNLMQIKPEKSGERKAWNTYYCGKRSPAKDKEKETVEEKEYQKTVPEETPLYTQLLKSDKPQKRKPDLVKPKNEVYSSKRRKVQDFLVRELDVQQPTSFAEITLGSTPCHIMNQYRVDKMKESHHMTKGTQVTESAMIPPPNLVNDQLSFKTTERGPLYKGTLQKTERCSDSIGKKEALNILKEAKLHDRQSEEEKQEHLIETGPLYIKNFLVNACLIKESDPGKTEGVILGEPFSPKSQIYKRNPEKSIKIEKNNVITSLHIGLPKLEKSKVCTELRDSTGHSISNKFDRKTMANSIMKEKSQYNNLTGIVLDSIGRQLPAPEEIKRQTGSPEIVDMTSVSPKGIPLETKQSTVSQSLSNDTCHAFLSIDKKQEENFKAQKIEIEKDKPVFNAELTSIFASMPIPPHIKMEQSPSTWNIYAESSRMSNAPNKAKVKEKEECEHWASFRTAPQYAQPLGFGADQMREPGPFKSQSPLISTVCPKNVALRKRKSDLTEDKVQIETVEEISPKSVFFSKTHLLQIENQKKKIKTTNWEARAHPDVLVPKAEKSLIDVHSINATESDNSLQEKEGHELEEQEHLAMQKKWKEPELPETTWSSVNTHTLTHPEIVREKVKAKTTEVKNTLQTKQVKLKKKKASICQLLTGTRYETGGNTKEWRYHLKQKKVFQETKSVDLVLKAVYDSGCITTHINKLTEIKMEKDKQEERIHILPQLKGARKLNERQMSSAGSTAKYSHIKKLRQGAGEKEQKHQKNLADTPQQCIQQLKSSSQQIEQLHQVKFQEDSKGKMCSESPSQKGDTDCTGLCIPRSGRREVFIKGKQKSFLKQEIQEIDLIPETSLESIPCPMKETTEFITKQDLKLSIPQQKKELKVINSPSHSKEQQLLIPGLKAQQQKPFTGAILKSVSSHLLAQLGTAKPKKEVKIKDAIVKGSVQQEKKISYKTYTSIIDPMLENSERLCLLIKKQEKKRKKIIKKKELKKAENMKTAITPNLVLRYSPAGAQLINTIENVVTFKQRDGKESEGGVATQREQQRPWGPGITPDSIHPNVHVSPVVTSTMYPKGIKMKAKKAPVYQLLNMTVYRTGSKKKELRCNIKKQKKFQQGRTLADFVLKDLCDSGYIPSHMEECTEVKREKDKPREQIQIPPQPNLMKSPNENSLEPTSSHMLHQPHIEKFREQVSAKGIVSSKVLSPVVEKAPNEADIPADQPPCSDGSNLCITEREEQPQESTSKAHPTSVSFSSMDILQMKMPMFLTSNTEGIGLRTAGKEEEQPEGICQNFPKTAPHLLLNTLQSKAPCLKRAPGDVVGIMDHNLCMEGIGLLIAEKVVEQLEWRHQAFLQPASHSSLGALQSKKPRVRTASEEGSPMGPTPRAEAPDFLITGKEDQPKKCTNKSLPKPSSHSTIGIGNMSSRAKGLDLFSKDQPNTICEHGLKWLMPLDITKKIKEQTKRLPVESCAKNIKYCIVSFPKAKKSPDRAQIIDSVSNGSPLKQRVREKVELYNTNQEVQKELCLSGAFLQSLHIHVPLLPENKAQKISITKGDEKNITYSTTRALKLNKSVCVFSHTLLDTDCDIPSNKPELQWNIKEKMVNMKHRKGKSDLAVTKMYNSIAASSHLISNKGTIDRVISNNIKKEKQYLPQKLERDRVKADVKGKVGPEVIILKAKESSLSHIVNRKEMMLPLDINKQESKVQESRDKASVKLTNLWASLPSPNFNSRIKVGKNKPGILRDCLPPLKLQVSSSVRDTSYSELINKAFLNNVTKSKHLSQKKKEDRENTVDVRDIIGLKCITLKGKKTHFKHMLHEKELQGNIKKQKQMMKEDPFDRGVLLDKPCASILSPPHLKRGTEIKRGEDIQGIASSCFQPLKPQELSYAKGIYEVPTDDILCNIEKAEQMQKIKRVKKALEETLHSKGIYLKAKKSSFSRKLLLSSEEEEETLQENKRVGTQSTSFASISFPTYSELDIRIRGKEAMLIETRSSFAHLLLQQSSEAGKIAYKESTCCDTSSSVKKAKEYVMQEEKKLKMAKVQPLIQKKSPLSQKFYLDLKNHDKKSQEVKVEPSVVLTNYSMPIPTSHLKLAIMMQNKNNRIKIRHSLPKLSQKKSSDAVKMANKDPIQGDITSDVKKTVEFMPQKEEDRGIRVNMKNMMHFKGTTSKAKKFPLSCVPIIAKGSGPQTREVQTNIKEGIHHKQERKSELDEVLKIPSLSHFKLDTGIECKEDKLGVTRPFPLPPWHMESSDSRKLKHRVSTLHDNSSDLKRTTYMIQKTEDKVKITEKGRMHHKYIAFKAEKSPLSSILKTTELQLNIKEQKKMGQDGKGKTTAFETSSTHIQQDTIKEENGELGIIKHCVPHLKLQESLASGQIASTESIDRDTLSHVKKTKHLPHKEEDRVKTLAMNGLMHPIDAVFKEKTSPLPHVFNTDMKVEQEHERKRKLDVVLPKAHTSMPSPSHHILDISIKVNKGLLHFVRCSPSQLKLHVPSDEGKARNEESNEDISSNNVPISTGTSFSQENCQELSDSGKVVYAEPITHAILSTLINILTFPKHQEKKVQGCKNEPGTTFSLKVLTPATRDSSQKMNIPELNALQHREVQEIFMKKRVEWVSQRVHDTRPKSVLSLNFPLQNGNMTPLDIKVEKTTTVDPSVLILPEIQAENTKVDATRWGKEQALLVSEQEERVRESLPKSLHCTLTFSIQSGDLKGKNKIDPSPTVNLEPKKLEIDNNSTVNQEEGKLKIDTNRTLELKEEKTQTHKNHTVNPEKETIKMQISNTVNKDVLSLMAEGPQIEAPVITTIRGHCPIKQKHKKDMEVSRSKQNTQLQNNFQRNARDSFYACIPLSPRFEGQKGRLTITDLKSEWSPKYLTVKAPNHPISQILSITGRGTPSNRKKFAYNKQKKMLLCKDALGICIRSLSISTMIPLQIEEAVKYQASPKRVRIDLSKFQEELPNASEIKGDISSTATAIPQELTKPVPQDTQPFVVDEQKIEKLFSVNSKANLSSEINEKKLTQPKEMIVTGHDTSRIIKEPDLHIFEQEENVPELILTPTKHPVLSENPKENVEAHMESNVNMNILPLRVEETQRGIQLFDTMECASASEPGDQNEPVQDKTRQKVQQQKALPEAVPKSLWVPRHMSPHIKSNKIKIVDSTSPESSLPVYEENKHVLESQLKNMKTERDKKCVSQRGKPLEMQSFTFVMIQDKLSADKMENVQANTHDNLKSPPFAEHPDIIAIHPKSQQKPFLDDFTTEEKSKLSNHLESKALQIKLNLIPEIANKSFQKQPILDEDNSWRLNPRGKKICSMSLEGINTVELNLKHKYQEDSPPIGSGKTLIVNVSSSNAEIITKLKSVNKLALSGTSSLSSADNKMSSLHILQKYTVEEKDKLFMHLSMKMLEIQMKVFPRIVTESYTIASAQERREPLSTCIHSGVKVPKRRNNILLFFEEKSLHQIDLDLQYKYLRFLLGFPVASELPKPNAIPKHDLKLNTSAECKKADDVGESCGLPIDTEQHISFKKQSPHESSSRNRKFQEPTPVCALDLDGNSTVLKDTSALPEVKSLLTPEKDKENHVRFQQPNTHKSLDIKTQGDAVHLVDAHSVQISEEFTDIQTNMEGPTSILILEEDEDEECIFLEVNPYLSQQSQRIPFELQKGIPLENLHKRRKSKTGGKQIYNEDSASHHSRSVRKHTLIRTPPSYKFHKHRKHRSSPKAQSPDRLCHSSLNNSEIQSGSSSISFNEEKLSGATRRETSYSLASLTESNIKLHLANNQGKTCMHLESKERKKPTFDVFIKNNLNLDDDYSDTPSKKKQSRKNKVYDYESGSSEQYFQSRHKSSSKPHHKDVNFYSARKSNQPFFYACVPADSLEVIPKTIRWTIPTEILRKRNFRIPLVAKMSGSWNIWSFPKKFLESLSKSLDLSPIHEM